MRGEADIRKGEGHGLCQRAADAARHPHRLRRLRHHHRRVGVHRPQDGGAPLAHRVRGHHLAVLPQGARPRQGEPQRGERHAHRHERGRHGGRRARLHHPRCLDARARRRGRLAGDAARGAVGRRPRPCVHRASAPPLHRGRRLGVSHRRGRRADAHRGRCGRQHGREAVRRNGPRGRLHGAARRGGRRPRDVLRQRRHSGRLVRHLQLPHAPGRRIPGGHRRRGRLVRRRAPSNFGIVVGGAAAGLWDTAGGRASRPAWAWAS